MAPAVWLFANLQIYPGKKKFHHKLGIIHRMDSAQDLLQPHRMSAGTPLAMQPAAPDMMGPGPGMMGSGLMGPSMGPGAVGAGTAHAPAHRAENFHHVAPPKRLRVGSYRAPFIIVRGSLTGRLTWILGAAEDGFRTVCWHVLRSKAGR